MYRAELPSNKDAACKGKGTSPQRRWYQVMFGWVKHPYTYLDVLALRYSVPIFPKVTIQTHAEMPALAQALRQFIMSHHALCLKPREFARRRPQESLGRRIRKWRGYAVT